ncbi:hypothetical protein ATANTOWER_030422 [Ataeniobius toweri]|uniref:Uncharacterized protein n=1 Tax=Ataeniobius toweri TaxID=208326 RepID=A0ABU7BAB3_9TELE|nr:hypothetical protein [Ataeniobius toweri]
MAVGFMEDTWERMKTFNANDEETEYESSVFPLHHLTSAPSSLSLALPPLPPRAIFLHRQIPGNHSVVWKQRAQAPLTQTHCYKSTLFLNVGVSSPNLDPHSFLSTSGP